MKPHISPKAADGAFNTLVNTFRNLKSTGEDLSNNENFRWLANMASNFFFMYQRSPRYEPLMRSCSEIIYQCFLDNPFYVICSKADNLPYIHESISSNATGKQSLHHNSICLGFDPSLMETKKFDSTRPDTVKVMEYPHHEDEAKNILSRQEFFNFLYAHGVDAISIVGFTKSTHATLVYVPFFMDEEAIERLRPARDNCFLVSSYMQDRVAFRMSNEYTPRATFSERLFFAYKLTRKNVFRDSVCYMLTNSDGTYVTLERDGVAHLAVFSNLICLDDYLDAHPEFETFEELHCIDMLVMTEETPVCIDPEFYDLILPKKFFTLVGVWPTTEKGEKHGEKQEK